MNRKLQKEIRERKEKLSHDRDYEFDDPDGWLKTTNDREELSILSLENRLLRKELDRKKGA